MNLKNKPLAMAYVPWQMFDEVMDGCGGLAMERSLKNWFSPL